MRSLVISAALFASLLVSTSWAGKTEDVQAAIKSTCNKDINSSEALRIVKLLYISCAPGQKVDVDGCQMSCLKENSGAVVGK